MVSTQSGLHRCINEIINEFNKQQLTIFYIVELNIRTDTRQSAHGKQISIAVGYFVFKCLSDFGGKKNGKQKKQIIVCINRQFFEFHSLSGHYYLSIAYAWLQWHYFQFLQKIISYLFNCLCVLPLDLCWNFILLR